MKRLLSALLALFILTACAPSAQSIQTAVAETQTTWTKVPTQTAYPTYTPPPTVYVTKIVIVTPTFTATPEFTPTATLDPLFQPKGDGFYLVGVDIAPGIWRSTGTGSKCYWEVTEKNGDIVDNNFGMSGGTAYIPASAFQVQFEKCGDWVYMGPP